jgi:biotin operon repressor
MTTTHTSATAGGTQCELILAALESGEWVPMPTLALVSGSYNVHSRISDLRKAGFQIEHKNQHEGRTIKSEYRLTN